MTRLLLFGLFVAATITPQQCGSTTPTSPSPGSGGGADNVLPVVVNAGPNNDYANGLFTSVTICVPGTSTCQTVDGILVDTGSEGLRVLSTALTLPLQPQTTTGGAPLVECAQFQDGFTWGPVQAADIKLAGRTAAAVPIQVIGEGAFPNIPQQCSSTGTAEDTLSSLDANGILGVGSFREDCGPACAAAGSSNPGLYYGCPSSGCTVASVANGRQLQNPVWLLNADSNGFAIQLPSVGAGGAPTVAGSMIFGIGTRANNALGSAHVLTTDPSGNFTTVFNGQSYSNSFIDSGSNGYFFLDTATTNLPLCFDNSDFYCPSRTQSLSATNRGANGVTTPITFSIANADTFFHGSFAASAELGGPNAGAFDWGLPFFFGRTVFIAIDGQAAPGGTAPYWAY